MCLRTLKLSLVSGLMGILSLSKVMLLSFAVMRSLFNLTRTAIASVIISINSILYKEIFISMSSTSIQGEFYTTDGSGNIALLKTHANWRKTWNLIVPGNFRGNGCTDLLFYDPTTGESEFYTTNASGNMARLKKYTDWRKTWNLIIPGNFGGNGYTDLLFYDPTTGEGEFYTTDGIGNIALLKKHTDWRNTWQLIVPGNLGGNDYTDLLFYDPTGGH